MKIKKGRGGFYYAELAHLKVPLRTRDLAVAEQKALDANLESLERAHEARLLTASTFQRLSFGREVSCAEALEAFKESLLLSNRSPLTSYRYWQMTGKFLKPYEMDSIQVITEHTVDRFVNPESDLSAGSRQVRYSAMLAFFRFCNAKGFIVGNPAELIQVRTHKLHHRQLEPRRKTPVFSVDTSKLSTFNKAVVVFGTTYGLRLSDVAQLSWASFEDPTKVVIWTDKTRRRLEFPMTPEIADLMAQVTRSGTEAVFPHQASIARCPINRSMLSVSFKRATKVTAHQLRHGFATRLRRDGESIAEIQRRLGHSSAKTTLGYLHD